MHAHTHTQTVALTQHEGSDNDEVVLEREDEVHGVEREDGEEQGPGDDYQPEAPQLVAEGGKVLAGARELLVL